MTAEQVIHIFASLGRGGGEMRTLDQLRALPRELVARHAVVTVAQPDGALVGQFEALGVEVEHVSGSDLRHLWRRFRGASVVHSHLGLTGAPFLAIARAANVDRRVAHFRSDRPELPSGWRGRILRRWGSKVISRAATDILGVSPGALEFGYSREWRSDPRCRVMLSGLNTAALDTAAEATLPVPGDALVMLHVGRDVAVKNRAGAVQGLERCLRIDDRVHLIFVGRDDSQATAALRKSVDEQGLAGHVHWLGERDDVPDLLRTAPLLLVTSHDEGMPGVVLEAVAAGCRVLASRLPGTELIQRAFPDQVQLMEPDDDWSEQAIASLTSPLVEPTRDEALQRFRQSEFALETAMPSFVELWHGTGEVVR